MSDQVSVIEGSRELPAAFAHLHASDESRLVAEDGLILRVQVGSGVHGTSIDGQDDRDEMGICLKPARLMTGVDLVPSGMDRGGQPVGRRGARGLMCLDTAIKLCTLCRRLRDDQRRGDHERGSRVPAVRQTSHPGPRERRDLEGMHDVCFHFEFEHRSVDRPQLNFEQPGVLLVTRSGHRTRLVALDAWEQPR